MKFVAYYNDHHHRIALNYLTASQVRSGEHLEILIKQDELRHEGEGAQLGALDWIQEKNLQSNERNLDNTTTRSDVSPA